MKNGRACIGSGSDLIVLEALMQLPLTGSGQSAKIRNEVTESPHLVTTCHCTDCQRITSSAFSLGIALPEAGFRLTAGEPRASAHGRQRSAQHSVRMPRLRMLDLQPAARWRHPRAGRNARRHIMAATDPAHLDAQQTALGQLCRG